MQKKIIKIIIFLTFVFIIGIFFVGLNKSSIYDTKNLTGKKLTRINLEHFNEEKKITMEDIKKNNFTLINFWASWCLPCRDEHPYLIKLKSSPNLKLLGVNFKDKKNNAIEFLKNYGNPYHDLTKDEFGKDSIYFGIYGIPESILVDKNLRIIKKFIGPITEKDFNFIINTIQNL